MTRADTATPRALSEGSDDSDASTGRSSLPFSKLAWIVLGYAVLVILFGAFVRASGSGDGCGMNWPDCHGALIPQGGDAARWIEFTHRASSALLLPLVLVLTFWSFRLRHAVRWAAGIALLFTLFEAAIGAKLVMAGWVGADDSVGRVAMMSVHLCNTFVLLASLTAAAYYSTGAALPRIKGKTGLTWGLGLAFLGLLLLGMSGAMSALGATLFPVDSLAEGLRQDLSPASHFLVRLRGLHPFIAVAICLYAWFLCGAIARRYPLSATVARVAAGLFVFQILFGLSNLLLHAPMAMQLGHLLIADAILVALSLTAMSSLGAPSDETDRPRASVGQYMALTKPRVISLLLVTTFAAMIVAAGGWPGGWLVLAAMAAGYMSAGSAHAFNMIADRDLDGAMERTAGRPTVTEAISPRDAFIFAVALGIGSFALFWFATTPLAAWLSLAGLLCYVFVYTLWLKRRTWHNIVIGGAAGAVPPLVGWAAVTGSLSPLAWIMFAIIFLWTPVHFWALALLIKDDYARAGVPMLPVVHGERSTVVQIAAYAIVTVAVSLAPFWLGYLGVAYLLGAIALNAVLVAYCAKLLFDPSRARARTLFLYSMVYLALLFAVTAIDKVGWA